MASYATERDIVERFLSLLNITNPRLSDPNAGLKTDTGADVSWKVDEGQIGFQVIEFHSDNRLAPKQGGSQLRRAEKTKAASGRPYTMAVRLDPIPALVSAIVRKVNLAARLDRHRFYKVILVVAASLPHDSPGATFLLDDEFESKLTHLNVATHELLASSAYDSAYIFNMLSLGGTPVVYEWERGNGWRRRGSAAAEESSKASLQAIQLLGALGGPQPAPGSLSDGLGQEFLSELLEAFADREPTLYEIEAFERFYRERHRK